MNHDRIGSKVFAVLLAAGLLTTTAARSEEQSAESLNSEGIKFLRSKEYDQAEQCFRKAHELSAQTNSAMAKSVLNNLAVLYRSMGKTSEAEKIEAQLAPPKAVATPSRTNALKPRTSATQKDSFQALTPLVDALANEYTASCKMRLPDLVASYQLSFERVVHSSAYQLPDSKVLLTFECIGRDSPEYERTYTVTITASKNARTGAVVVDKAELSMGDRRMTKEYAEFQARNEAAAQDRRRLDEEAQRREQAAAQQREEEMLREQQQQQQGPPPAGAPQGGPPQGAQPEGQQGAPQ